MWEKIKVYVVGTVELISDALDRAIEKTRVIWFFLMVVTAIKILFFM